MSVKRIDGDKIEISIKDLFGVTIKRQKTKSSKKPGLCQGVELHTYSERDANRLKHKVILLSHPSEEVCTRWYTAVKNRLNSKCMAAYFIYRSRDHTGPLASIYKLYIRVVNDSGTSDSDSTRADSDSDSDCRVF